MSIHHILLFKIERNVRSNRSRGKHDRIVYTRTRSIVRSSFTEGGIFFSRLATEPSRDIREFLRFLDEFLPSTRAELRSTLGPFSHRLKRLKLSIERTSGSAVLTSLPVSSHHYESEIIIDGKVGEGSQRKMAGGRIGIRNGEGQTFRDNLFRVHTQTGSASHEYQAARYTFLLLTSIIFRFYTSTYVYLIFFSRYFSLLFLLFLTRDFNSTQLSNNLMRMNNC